MANSNHAKQIEEAVHWGTLEVRRSGSGHAGSSKGKFCQIYSRHSHLLKALGPYDMKKPTTMRSLRGRRISILNMADSILENLDKVSGRLDIAMYHFRNRDLLLFHCALVSNPSACASLPHVRIATWTCSFFVAWWYAHADVKMYFVVSKDIAAQHMRTFQ